MYRKEGVGGCWIGVLGRGEGSSLKGGREEPEASYVSPDVGSLTTIVEGEGKCEDASLIEDNNERGRELDWSGIIVLFCSSSYLVLVLYL